MPVLYYYNQAQLGTTYNNITANSLLVGNFVATSKISETDFRNASNTYISTHDSNQQLSDYLSAAQGVTQFAGGPTGGAISPFWLIVHPTTYITENYNNTEYEYDGCRIMCYPSSDQSGHIMGYMHNVQTYDFQPLWSYVHAAPAGFTGNIPVGRIKAVRWVAWWDSTNNKVGALRPLYAIDMNGTGWVGGNGSCYFYGSLVPSSTVDAWFENIVQRDDPDRPPAPQDPNDSDNQSATAPAGTNWSWLNQFSIMNWDDDDPWPSKLLVDVDANSYDSLYWFYNYNDYFAWNDTNDEDNLYHGYAIAGRLQYPYRDRIDDLYNHVASMHTWGSNVLGYEKVDGNSGRFTTLSYPLLDTNTYDQFWATAPLYGGSVIIDNKMTMEYDNTIPGLNTLTIRDNGSYFNGDANYPNAPFSFGVFQDTTLSAASFPLVCIIRYRSHYYLGGICAFVNTDANNWSRYGFAVICRIDKLKDMPNFGGPDPDDPGGPTGDGPGISPDDTFGTGTGFGNNPSTDDGVNNSTGDGTGPIDPGLGGPNGDGGLGSPGYYGTGDAPSGGYFDPDGTYHAPDGTVYGPQDPRNPRNKGAYYAPDGTYYAPDDPNNPRNKGTGEKQSNPVNTSNTPNNHDGSVGNGTGNPHGNDAQVTDPSTTLPAAGTTGTIGGGGFLSIFTPSQVELDSFANELLNTTTLNAIKQYFSSNPMDGIFGLHILPYSGFAGSTVANPKIGSYDFSTTVTLAGEEYLNIDYGSMYIDFVYDGYENFAPQSDAKIFLPFIGTKDIDINLIQGCNISLKYNVSLVTGDIYAYLYAQWAGKYQQAGTLQGVDHLLYHWQGNCAVNIPLSHVDSSNYISGAMQIAGGITSLAAGAVAGSPFTIPSGITGVTQGIAEMGRSSIVTSGNISGVAAFMGSREPYLILSRPIIAFDSQYNHYLGRKSNAIARIGVLNEGSFTIMRNVDLSGISATNDELQMIEGFMKGGFYV